jgi:hypothetical protein
MNKASHDYISPQIYTINHHYISPPIYTIDHHYINPQIYVISHDEINPPTDKTRHDENGLCAYNLSCLKQAAIHKISHGSINSLSNTKP